MGKTDNGSAKGSLRKFMLSAQPKVKKLTIEIEGKKRDIEVHEPSMTIRDGYLKRIGLKVTGDDDIEMDGAVGAAHVWLVIGCTYVPSTNPPERVFSMKDEKTLMGLPPGAFTHAITEEAQKFMQRAAVDSKNSEAIPSAS